MRAGCRPGTCEVSGAGSSGDSSRPDHCPRRESNLWPQAGEVNRCGAQRERVGTDRWPTPHRREGLVLRAAGRNPGDRPNRWRSMLRAFVNRFQPAVAVRVRYPAFCSVRRWSATRARRSGLRPSRHSSALSLSRQLSRGMVSQRVPRTGPMCSGPSERIGRRKAKAVARPQGAWTGRRLRRNPGFILGLRDPVRQDRRCQKRNETGKFRPFRFLSAWSRPLRTGVDVLLRFLPIRGWRPRLWR